MNTWKNPNDFGLAVITTKQCFAQDFLSKGRVKFNSPENWVLESRLNGQGRGDIFEGILAFCSINDKDTKKAIQRDCASGLKSGRIVENLSQSIEENRIFFRDPSVMNLPCYCFYTLKYDLFEVPRTTGKQTLKTKIPASYFADFATNSSKTCGRPALIVINDFIKFKKRLVSYLVSIGVKENMIYTGSMQYYDFEKYGANGTINFNPTYGGELFVKSNEFQHQSEGRFVINVSDDSLREKLITEPMDLGSMEDIATLHEGAFKDGIDVEMSVNIT